MNEKVYSRDEIEEFTRNARAYGWEVGKGKPLTETISTSPDNPFLDPNWRDHLGEPKPTTFGLENEHEPRHLNDTQRKT